MSLNIATGPALGGLDSGPDLLSSFGGCPGGVKVVNSYFTPPQLPGIDFEDKADVFKEVKALPF